MSNKEQILKEVAVLFMRFGIKAITMDEVAQELHVSKRTLYELFGNKDSLIQLIVQNFIENHKKSLIKLEQNTKNSIDLMLKLSRFILTIYSELNQIVLYDLKKFYPKIWKIVDDFQTEFVKNKIKENLLAGIRDGLYREDINPEILSSLYVVQSKLFSDDVIIISNRIDFKVFINQFFHYHMFGIMSNKGVKYYLKREKNIDL